MFCMFLTIIPIFISIRCYLPFYIYIHHLFNLNYKSKKLSIGSCEKHGDRPLSSHHRKLIFDLLVFKQTALHTFYISLSLSLSLTDTHTHTHIYIYIYMMFLDRILSLSVLRRHRQTALIMILFFFFWYKILEIVSSKNLKKANK